MPLTAPVLTTARLVLAPVSPADRDAVVELHRDDRVTRHILDGIPDAPWKADVYLRWASALHARGIGPWSARRLGSARFLGLFTLTPFVEGDDALLELGGRLGRAGWSGDFAVESGAALIEYAFERLGHDRLMATHHPDNPTVPAVLARLGFSGLRTATVFGRDALAMELRSNAWRAQGCRPRPPAVRLRTV